MNCVACGKQIDLVICGTCGKAALPPVRSEPLLCLLDAVRELVAAYDEYERDQSATCARVYRGRLRLKDRLAEYDRPNSVIDETSGVGTKPTSRAGTVTSKAGKVGP
jgi:hypothetical protein